MFDFQTQSTENTKQLLKHISHHLSSRVQCKNIEYKVVIETSNIHMLPNIEVFKSTHHRKITDKENVINHIFNYHMHELSDDIANNFISGVYVYKKYPMTKRRKWIRFNLKYL